MRPENMVDADPTSGFPMRITLEQIAAAASRTRAERAALEASMSVEQLAQHDAQEAAKPDIFDVLEAEQVGKLCADDIDEEIALWSLGPDGIEYLRSLRPSDYTAFDLDEP